MKIQEFKLTKVAADIFGDLINILEECTIDDVDIQNCSLKALTNQICEPVINKTNQLENNGKTDNNTSYNNNEDQDKSKNLLSRLDDILGKYGDECDIILSCDEVSEEEKEEIHSLRSIINTVINIIPEEKHECQVDACGRKFKTKEELKVHTQRRHKQLLPNE